jgi:hypothetical protein
MADYNPWDWYWLADDHRVFASKRAIVVTDTDTAYLARVADGMRATPWPRDGAGNQTNSAMQSVMTPYGITVP